MKRLTLSASLAVSLVCMNVHATDAAFMNVPTVQQLNLEPTGFYKPTNNCDLDAVLMSGDADYTGCLVKCLEAADRCKAGPVRCQRQLNVCTETCATRSLR